MARLGLKLGRDEKEAKFPHFLSNVPIFLACENETLRETCPVSFHVTIPCPE